MNVKGGFIMSKELEALKDLNELSLEFDKLHTEVYGKSICSHEQNLFRHIKQALIDKDKRIKELGAYVDILLKDANEGMKIANQDLQDKLDNIQELLDLTPKDIRDVAVYTYQELNEIIKEATNEE